MKHFRKILKSAAYLLAALLIPSAFIMLAYGAGAGKVFWIIAPVPAALLGMWLYIYSHTAGCTTKR